jgi:hypothetical protein
MSPALVMAVAFGGLLALAALASWALEWLGGSRR